jgi:hypothetical protein
MRDRWMDSCDGGERTRGGRMGPSGTVASAEIRAVDRVLTGRMA